MDGDFCRIVQDRTVEGEARAGRSSKERKRPKRQTAAVRFAAGPFLHFQQTLGVLDTLDLVAIPKSVQPSTERRVWVDRHLTACLKLAARDPWLIGPEMARTVHETVLGGVAVHSGWVRGCTRSTMSAAGDGEEAWGMVVKAPLSEGRSMRGSLMEDG
ncbi:hypothetical protein CABS01_08083 [Colletotrichum abscissum]|uniref:Uncharacterized protein n=1 Tax=Colletotrichum abscissum TaxID=1671311 RepID=A0A9P9XCC5_9PEZI|nr:uncharacterized protein CABS01_08083 [Colletotrichum abscissum]KAI3547730.1 hypothetical protein CABS02_08542 [Colletotrichum abscissum]KAK1508853.1 hypothetical protein CABS01_08083 [Colletotrichum abscissum]